MSNLVITQSGAVRIARIARPDVHNALNAALIRDIADAVEAAASDPALRAVVITGTGEKAFSAGADLAEIRTLDAAAAIAYMRQGQDQFRRIACARIPVIAAVNGLALGGGFELVLACTFAVLSDKASLGLPEAGLGLIPGYGGTQRLQRRVGANVAAYTMLTGSRIDAQRAYALGLAVVPPTAPDELLTVALRIATEIAGKGPKAVETILDLTLRGAELGLDTALDLESYAAALAIAGSESVEGIAAFSERRPARFHVTDVRS